MRFCLNFNEYFCIKGLPIFCLIRVLGNNRRPREEKGVTVNKKGRKGEKARIGHHIH